MNLKTIIAAALLTASSTAGAATWEMVGSSTDEVLFLDQSSVHTDNGVAKARVLLNYNQITHLGDDMYPHKSKLMLYELDCARRELGYAQWSLHALDLGSGETIWADGANGVAMFRPSIGSPEGRLLDRVCGTPLAQH